MKQISKTARNKLKGQKIAKTIINSNPKNEQTTQVYSLTKISESEFVLSVFKEADLYFQFPIDLKIEQCTANFYLNSIPINPSFFGQWMPLDMTTGFPAISLKIISTKFSDTKKTRGHVSEPLAVVRLREIRFSERIYTNCFKFSSFENSQIVFEEAKLKLLNSEVYLSLAKAIENFIKAKSKVHIFINGEKNSGKSTLTNFLLNYALNCFQNSEIAYSELDLGKPAFGLHCYISSFRPILPLFCSGPNLMLLNNPAEKMADFYVGENTPYFSLESYSSKVESLIQVAEKFFSSSQKQKIHVVNYHGFTKGFGKVLAKKIKGLLKGDFLDVKLFSKGEIKAGVRGKKPKDIIFKGELTSGSFFVPQPQFFIEQRQRLVFDFISQNKNFVLLKLQNLKITITGQNFTREFYNDCDKSLLQMILFGSLMNVNLKFSDGLEKNWLGLVVEIKEKDNFIKMNVPFLPQKSIDNALLVEISRTTYHDFCMAKYLTKEVFSEADNLPFGGSEIKGFGSKVHRKKISKRR